MIRYAQLERHALADTMLAVGPDAPTLCGTWRVRNLAAHLVIRETRPDLAAGMFIPKLRDRLEKAQAEMAAGDFENLVERLLFGPPRWGVMGIPAVDSLANLLEFYVHHEDVLRAAPEWTPRELEPRKAEEIWNGLGRMAGVLYRKSPVGVILVADGVGRHVAKRPDEGGSAVVRGSVAEVVLYSYGRRDVATVKLSGPDSAISALTNATLSL